MKPVPTLGRASGLFFALALLLAGSAGGGQPQPLNLTSTFDGGQRTAWVEQQDDWPKPADPIVNPLPGCRWSVNDHVEWRRLGYLDAGASATTSLCVVSDFNPVFATRSGVTAWWSMAVYGFVGVHTDAPGVTVSVCYQPQGRCFTGVTSVCVRASYLPDDPALTDIAGSNGGRGVITAVTVTVMNVSGRKIKTVDVRGGFSSDVFFPEGCDPAAVFNHDYPMAWTAT